jgi:hypothetical protein
MFVRIWFDIKWENLLSQKKWAIEKKKPKQVKTKKEDKWDI